MLLDDILQQFSRFLKHGNDDRIDRFHYLYTVIGLSVYLAFITSKQYYGEQIQCIPASHSDYNKYAHSMCWINGTYSFELKQGKNEVDYASLKPIKYYQWLPFIILLQCLLFRIPSFIWQYVIYLNGFDMVHVTKNVMKETYLKEYYSKDNWIDTQNVNKIFYCFLYSILKMNADDE
jgi:hypothetical protein